MTNRVNTNYIVMKTILLFAFTISFSLAFSQYRTDIGVFAGGANYLGEIGGNEQVRRDFVLDMKLEQTRKSLGAFFRHRFTSVYGVSGTLTYAEIGGHDNLTTNLGRKSRNLSFKNKIVELAGRGEYYFYNVYDVGGHSRYIMDFRPYFFGGLGVFYHNPVAELDGESYDLRPLKTEGQEKPYSNINISIPVGMGFYFTYNKRYRLTCELGWRKTFTDYLDDVSTTYASEDVLGSDIAIALANRNNEITNTSTTANSNNYSAGNKRGDSKHADSYLIASVGMSYVLRGDYIHSPPTRGGHYQPIKRRTLRSKF